MSFPILFFILMMMIQHESAFDLFQRLNGNVDNEYQSIVNRLNRYHQILFPNGIHGQIQLVELLDSNRALTKTFLHGFIADQIEYMKYRQQPLVLASKSEHTMMSNSPTASKETNHLDAPSRPTELTCTEPFTFLYIDTECKACPFPSDSNSDRIQWYDCETSSVLVGTLLRLEHLCFLANPTRRYLLIIDSGTQVPLNDFLNVTTSNSIMSVEENKLLTIQWHTILCRILIKHKLPCILVEHLDIDAPMFNTIRRRDGKIPKRTSKNNPPTHIPYSEFAFGRLAVSEHYALEWNDRLQYRQIRTDDMVNFRYENQQFPNNDVEMQ